MLELNAVTRTLNGAPAVDPAAVTIIRVSLIAPVVIPTMEVPPGDKSKVRMPVIG